MLGFLFLPDGWEINRLFLREDQPNYHIQPPATDETQRYESVENVFIDWNGMSEMCDQNGEDDSFNCTNV